MDTQTLALLIAGTLLPFIHERILGAHLDGRLAVWTNFALCLAAAAIATAATGGFDGAPGFADPTPLIAFFLVKTAAVFTLSQLVFAQFQKQVQQVGGTAPTGSSAPSAP